MTLGVVGKKIGMTRVFDETGAATPVTVIQVEKNRITARKSVESDGYSSVQVTSGDIKASKLGKAEAGHFSKSGVAAGRGLWEFRLGEGEGDELAVGGEFGLELFEEGQNVDVTGTSIGKGFQGSVKRHGFARGLMTHGSKSHRQHGSVGAGTYPGRIFPGKKMHGHMGNETTTIKQLKIMRVEDDCIIIRGNVPGKKGNLIRVAPAKIVGKNC